MVFPELVVNYEYNRTHENESATPTVPEWYSCE